MVMAPQTMFPQSAERERISTTGKHIYYRLRNGWLAHNSAMPSDIAKLTANKGATPLTQYGYFVPGQRSEDARGNPFSASNEGWRVGFQNGMAPEFPVDQIIAYGWHVTPPYKEVEFPQLEGVELPPPLYCPECDAHPMFIPLALASHLRLRHEYTRADINSYGEDVGVNFRRMPTPRAPRRTMRVDEPAEMTLTEPDAKDNAYICDVCGWAPRLKTKRKSGALRFHKRKHMPKPEKQATVAVPEDRAPEGSDQNGIHADPGADVHELGAGELHG